MNRLLIILLLLLHSMLYAGNRADSLLLVLDRTIEEANGYVQLKEHRLTELRNSYNSAHSAQVLYELSYKSYIEYKSYKYDSAYVFAERMLTFAEKLNKKEYIVESRIALAFSCLSAGLYKEATEIAHSIDTSNIDTHSKARVYSLLSVLYLSMSDFAAADPYYHQYRMLAIDYCHQSLDLYKENSSEYLLTHSRERQLMEDYTGAIDYAERFLMLVDDHENDYAIAASMLGYFHEVHGNIEKAIEYFTLAAIADIKMATKETSAIRQLADLLFSRGDVNKAYAYAMIALDDANFYNARQRKIEVGRTLPIIEAGRFAIIQQQKDKLMVYSVLISVLFVLFVVATFIILMQKKRLTSAREKILQQNEELLTSNEHLTEIQRMITRQNAELLNINRKLKEVSHIKDEYIGYFFSANSIYIEKSKEYKKKIARKIKHGQIDDLLQEFSSNDLRKEKEEMFALFDQIFIKIFPDFVTRYNQLFLPGDQFILNSEGSLSPEIRIFALIRLGITKSDDIARFLDFSLSTVKNYKSKVKNRSLIPNENFEQKILEIDSVETSFDEVQL